MQSIKGTFLLFTLCLGAGGIWAKPSSAIFADVWGDLKDGGKSIIDGLRNATKDGTSIGKDIFDKLGTEKGQFLNKISELGDDLSTAISESLTTGLKDLSQSLTANITALKKTINSELNIIRKRALLSGLAALQELSSVADELESALSDFNLKMGETVNLQINETLLGLLEWQKQQLERVDEATDGAGVRLATDLIDGLIERYTRALVTNLEHLEIVKGIFEMELNDKINEYSDYARQLIIAMNRCSLVSILRCQSDIEEAIENLANAASVLQALLSKGNQLIKAGVNASDSMISLLNQLAEDKLKIEKQLDDLIKGNPGKTETTTANSTSSGDSSNYSDGSSGVSATLDDLLAKLSASSKSLLGGLLNNTASSKELVAALKGDFVEDITLLAQNLSNALSQALIDDLANHALKLQTNITDLAGNITSEKNIIKKKALNNGLEALKALDSTVGQLQTALTDVSLKLDTSLNDQIDEALTELKDWGEKQLARVNKATDGAGMEPAVEIVKLLTQRYIEGLAGAVKSFELSKSYFELDVNNIISEYSGYAQELIANMNRCLSKSVSSGRCQSSTEELVAKLDNAQNELKLLLRKSDEMLKEASYASEAIASLLKQLAKDKLQCESYLNDIIADNPSATESDTEPTTSGSESTTTSDSTTATSTASTASTPD